jgi:hypothetical protein
MVTSRYYHQPPYLATKTVTFTGAANLGAVGNVPLFTVTGEVIVEYIVAYSVTTPVGATATLALGVTNSTALFIAATTATNLATGEFWTEATGGGTANAGIAVPAAMKGILVTSDIVGTVAVAAITGGVIRFDVYWRPLSANGALVAA